MKSHSLTLIFSLFISLSASAGGVGIGNGGDSAYCELSNLQPLDGYYSLDFLMTLDGDGLSDAVPVQSWQESQNRIRQILAAKYPAMLESFDKFLKDASNRNDWTKSRIWLPAPHGLIDISDEQLRRTLPENCGRSSSADKVTLIQTVVRGQRPEMITYEFDSKVMSELKQKPLQYSFLMVHEWLWDHTNDPQTIRWVNQFLHSAYTENLPAQQFQHSLKSIGISFGYSGFWSVCNRSPEIRIALEETLQKTCGNIEAKDLDVITEIEIERGGSLELNVNDLNSLGRLKKFTLTNSKTQKIPKEFFAKNPSLEFVAFTQIPMANLDIEMFKGNSALAEIFLYQVPITEIPVAFAWGLPENMKLLSIQLSMLNDVSQDVLKVMTQRRPYMVDLSINSLLNKKKVQEAARALSIERLFIF